MKAHFPDYPVGTKTLPNWLLKVLGWFDSDVKLLVPLLSKEFYGITTKSKDVLGIDYDRKSVEQGIVELC